MSHHLRLLVNQSRKLIMWNIWVTLFLIHYVMTTVWSAPQKWNWLSTFCSPMYTAQLQLYINFMLFTIIIFRLLLNLPKYCSGPTMFLAVEYHVPNSKAVIRNLVYKLMALNCKKLVTAIINSDLKWQPEIRFTCWLYITALTECTIMQHYFVNVFPVTGLSNVYMASLK